MKIDTTVRGLVTLGLAVMLVGAGGEQATPSLVDAARNADGETVRALVEGGADVNAAEGDGSTALLWASHWDDLAMAQLLIGVGADVNAANDLGATPLWAASMNGSLVMVEALLAAGAEANKSLRLGETPLMIASRTGDPAVVALLLKHGADPNVRGPRAQTALMWAAARRHSDVVAVLIDHGADVHARSEVWNQMMGNGTVAHPEHQRWFDHGGNTALMFAARVGDLASAKHLVDAGAKVNDTSAWGVSVLTMAVYADVGSIRVGDYGVGAEGRTRYRVVGQERFRTYFSDSDLAAFLLERGADPNLGHEELTGLHAAIMHRNEDAVRLLLEGGADPNVPLGTWTPVRRLSYGDYAFDRAWVGATPLWLAARFATADIVRLLVDHGADPSAVHTGVYYSGGRGGVYSERQEEITTPLMAAVGMSRTGRAWVPELPPTQREVEILETVELLVALGVEVGAVDQNGRTLLDGARALGYESVIEFLTAAGAH